MNPIISWLIFFILLRAFMWKFEIPFPSWWYNFCDAILDLLGMQPDHFQGKADAASRRMSKQKPRKKSPSKPVSSTNEAETITKEETRPLKLRGSEESKPFKTTVVLSPKQHIKLQPESNGISENEATSESSEEENEWQTVEKKKSNKQDPTEMKTLKSKTRKQRQNVAKKEKQKEIKKEIDNLQQARYENFLRTKASTRSTSTEFEGWIQVGKRRPNKTE